MGSQTERKSYLNVKSHLPYLVEENLTNEICPALALSYLRLPFFEEQNSVKDHFFGDHYS